MNRKGSWGATAWIITIVVIIACSILFKFWLAPMIFLAQVDSAHEIIDDTYDADNAVYNYEWFKTQYEKINAAEKMIINTQEQLDNFDSIMRDPKDWDYMDKQERSRLVTILLGQKNQYESLVADYNARSNMANREIFKDGLPFDVEKKIW